MDKAKQSLRRTLRAGGEDVYVHRKTGKVFIPKLSSQKEINDFNPSSYRKVTGNERNKKIDEVIEKEKFSKERKKQERYEKHIQWWGRRKEGALDKGGRFKKWFGKKTIGAGGKIKKKGKYAWRHKGAAVNKTIGTTKKARKAAADFGYSLPGPFQIWTLAWQKASKSMKLLVVIVFAVVLLFVPWGVFYYAGWAVGAAFMFLISLIYWVFISIFNGLAYVIVTGINGVATIVMSGIIAMVETVLNLFQQYGKWANGRYLMKNALIEYDQIANVPSLYKIVEPTWQSWMNDTIIGHLMFSVFKISYPFNWIGTSLQNFIESLNPEQSLIFGLIIIAIPIVILAFVYYKNRHVIRGY